MDSYWDDINGYFGKDGQTGKGQPIMPSVDDIHGSVNYKPEMPTASSVGDDDDLKIDLSKNKLKDAKSAFSDSFEDDEEEEEDEDEIAEGEEGAPELAGEAAEEGEEEEEDAPALKKEAYMTKAYYLPGYVDTTPEKEYPPHIRAFKNYLKNIGEFDKHGYEKEDYSPDSSNFAPDTSGFAPDSSGFAPDSSSFAPDTSTFGVGNKSFKPETGSFGAGQRSGSSFRP